MSAIVGVYLLDGRPVDRADLERMQARIAHRGPDAAGLWHDGPAGLGHQMLWTRPESLAERLPLADPAGQCVITADARIDNRPELIATLGLSGPAAAISDGELILASYRRWGERCPEHLLGDFAFAIWDRRERRLFCARDHFGVKPFYYHYVPGRSFVFGSEVKAILSLGRLSWRLNEARIADYLATSFDDPAETFYAEIWRLPPAHRLVVDGRGIRLEAYWALDPTREIRLRSDGEYAEAFRALFTEAVRCRLASAFPVGALLSGGLDSSSVACVARDLLAASGGPPLSTFSAVFETLPECDERRFQEAVLAQGGFAPPCRVLADRLSPLLDLDHALWHHDEPLYGPGRYLTWALSRAAQERGVRVLLDGHGGDETVSHGHGFPAELARAGRWLPLAVALRGVARACGEPYWRVAARFARPAIAHRLRRVRGYGRLACAGGRLRRRPGDGRGGAAGGRGAAAVVSSALARRVDLAGREAARRRTWPEAIGEERAAHYRELVSGVQAYAFEMLDKSTAPFALERRYPFRDKRLVEFCLALPPEQKLGHAGSRLVLRRAMGGLLPKEVQWRAQKTDFAPGVALGLLRFERARLENLFLDAPERIERFVDVAYLRQAYGRLVQAGKGAHTRDLFAVWSALSLGLWLERGAVLS